MRRQQSLLTAAMLILVVPIFAGAQIFDKAALETKWLNIPSAPLQFRANPNGRNYAIGNFSDAFVVGYRVGCVVQEADGLRILSKRAPQKKDLAPHDRVKNEVASEIVMSAHGNWNEPFCEGKAKLAILEVVFSDGGFWKIRK